MTYDEFETQKITAKLNVLHDILEQYEEDTHFFGVLTVKVKNKKMSINDVTAHALFDVNRQDLELFGQTVEVFVLKINYEIDKILATNKEFKHHWDKIVNI